MKMGNGDGRFLCFVSLVVTNKGHETESVNHKEFKRENSRKRIEPNSVWRPSTSGSPLRLGQNRLAGVW